MEGEVLDKSYDGAHVNQRSNFPMRWLKCVELSAVSSQSFWSSTTNGAPRRIPI